MEEKLLDLLAQQIKKKDEFNEILTQLRTALSFIMTNPELLKDPAFKEELNQILEVSF